MKFFHKKTRLASLLGGRLGSIPIVLFLEPTHIYNHFKSAGLLKKACTYITSVLF